jgi:hypothetical protein
MYERAMPQQLRAPVETIELGLAQELIALWQDDLGELSPIRVFLHIPPKRYIPEIGCPFLDNYQAYKQ